MSIWMFGVFHIFSEAKLAGINTSIPVFVFWSQVIVQFQNDYYLCTLDHARLSRVKQKQHAKIYKKIKQNNLLNWIVPNFAIKMTTQIVSQIIIWKNLENIHQRLFFKKRVHALPNLENNVKRKAILVLIVIDRLMFGLQNIIGKFS